MCAAEFEFRTFSMTRQHTIKEAQIVLSGVFDNVLVSNTKGLEFESCRTHT